MIGKTISHLPHDIKVLNELFKLYTVEILQLKQISHKLLSHGVRILQKLGEGGYLSRKA